MVDNLTEEFTKNVEEAKLAKITSMKLHLTENEDKHKCLFWTLYIVLFSIILTVSTGIGTCFVYFHWYLKK